MGACPAHRWNGIGRDKRSREVREDRRRYCHTGTHVCCSGGGYGVPHTQPAHTQGGGCGSARTQHARAQGDVGGVERGGISTTRARARAKGVNKGSGIFGSHERHDVFIPGGSTGAACHGGVGREGWEGREGRRWRQLPVCHGLRRQPGEGREEKWNLS
jgi:hypothetical protein